MALIPRPTPGGTIKTKSRTETEEVQDLPEKDKTWTGTETNAVKGTPADAATARPAANQSCVTKRTQSY